MKDLFCLGPVVVDFALPVAASTATKPAIGVFRGSRNAVPAGAVLGTTGASRPTLRSASDILAKPHLWPADVLQLAIDRLAEQLATQPAFADVASTDGWFAD